MIWVETPRWIPPVIPAWESIKGDPPESETVWVRDDAGNTDVGVFIDGRWYYDRNTLMTPPVAFRRLGQNANPLFDDD